MTRIKCVGIVGPTNTQLVEEKVGLQTGTLESAAREIGAFLAAQSLGIVCAPMQGVALWALEAYKQASGMNSLALWPRSEGLPEGSTATGRAKPDLADRVENDLSWGDAPFELAKASGCLAAIGLSCGTIVEIAVTKWIDRMPVFVVNSLMTRIPVEVASELDIRYCNDITDLKRNLAEFFSR